MTVLSSMRVLAASGSLGAGFIGFLVVLALIVAAVFLFRSMSRHLRNVPKTFDQPPPTRPEDERKDDSVGR